MKNQKLVIAALAGILAAASPLASNANEEAAETPAVEENACNGEGGEATDGAEESNSCSH